MIVQILVAAFFIIGVIDHFFGNRLKLGEEFYKGLSTFPSLILGMLGIYSLSPLLGKGIQFIFSPVSRFSGLDVTFFSSVLLGTDMGGYRIAKELAESPEIGRFCGIILTSLLGTTLSFSLPLALSILSARDHNLFMKGFILGMISLPFGALAGGLIQGLSVSLILPYTLPLLIFSALLGFLFFWKEQWVILLFKIFQYILKIIGTTGLLLQGVRSIAGFNLVPDMLTLQESFLVISQIALFLGGVYSFIHIINRLLSRYLSRLGEKLDLTDNAFIAILGNSVSNLVIFAHFEKLPEKDQLLTAVLSVSGAFMIGGQLAYISSVEPNMVPAFLISKVTATAVSLLLFAVSQKRILSAAITQSTSSEKEILP